MSKIQNTKGRYVIWHNEMDGKYLTTEDQTQAYQSGYDSGYTYGVATSFDSGYTSGYTVGYESGYTDGETAGFATGYQSGFTDGTESGFTNGYQSGFTDGTESGFTNGYTSGYTDGYDSGYTDGVAVSFESGYTSGYTVGFTSGYTSGYTAGVRSVPLYEKNIYSNGTYTVDRGGWNEVNVNVPNTPDWTSINGQKYFLGGYMLAFYLENVPSGTTIMITMQRTSEEYRNDTRVHWGDGRSTFYPDPITGHTYTNDFSGWIYLSNSSEEGTVDITDWGNIFAYCKAINIGSEQNDYTKSFFWNGSYPSQIPQNSVKWYAGYTQMRYVNDEGDSWYDDLTNKHLELVNKLGHIEHLFLAPN